MCLTFQFFGVAFYWLAIYLNPFDAVTAIRQARNQSHFFDFLKIIMADLVSLFMD